MSEYIVPEVKGELIADVAKTLANSRKPLTLNELSKSYEGQFSAEYVRRAAVACSQIKLALFQSGAYACNESDRDDLKKATKSELYIAFRKRLQDYAPFLLYIDLLSKEFSSVEAAMRIRGILNVGSIPGQLERTLRGMGQIRKNNRRIKRGQDCYLC